MRVMSTGASAPSYPHVLPQPISAHPTAILGRNLARHTGMGKACLVKTLRQMARPFTPHREIPCPPRVHREVKYLFNRRMVGLVRERRPAVHNKEQKEHLFTYLNSRQRVTLPFANKTGTFGMRPALAEKEVYDVSVLSYMLRPGARTAGGSRE